MEFTREAWENAPEGARLEYACLNGNGWKPVTLIGFSAHGRPVVEEAKDNVWACANCALRIILPKRKVTVQLWRTRDGEEVSRVGVGFYANWTLLGEHTFEIEGCDAA